MIFKSSIWLFLDFHSPATYKFMYHKSVRIYLIDPPTRSCFLNYGNITKVFCDKWRTREFCLAFLLRYTCCLSEYGNFRSIDIKVIRQHNCSIFWLLKFQRNLKLSKKFELEFQWKAQNESDLSHFHKVFLAYLKLPIICIEEQRLKLQFIGSARKPYVIRCNDSKIDKNILQHFICYIAWDWESENSCAATHVKWRTKLTLSMTFD